MQTEERITIWRLQVRQTITRNGFIDVQADTAEEAIRLLHDHTNPDVIAWAGEEPGDAPLELVASRKFDSYESPFAPDPVDVEGAADEEEEEDEDDA